MYCDDHRACEFLGLDSLQAGFEEVHRVRPKLDVLDSLPYTTEQFSNLSRGIDSCPPPSSNARNPR
jgi:hypothetical protein